MKYKIEISRASVDTATMLAPLFDQYRQFYEQPSDVNAAKEYLAKRMENEQSVIFYAKYEQHAVGFLQLYYGFSSIHMKKIFILNDLYVAPSARKQGVAESLIQKAVGFAKENGAHHMTLTTAKDNPAQELYRRLGWHIESKFEHFQMMLAKT